MQVQTRHRIRVALVIGALALVSGACAGGDDDDEQGVRASSASPTTTTTTSSTTSSADSETATTTTAAGSSSTTSGYKGTIPPSSRTTGTTASTSVPSTVDPDDTDVDDAEAHVQFAKLDVARRTGGDADDVRVLEMESVVWPDASLGCPANGRTYDQGDVAGYRIELQWTDRRFSYHGRNGADPFLCQKLD